MKTLTRWKGSYPITLALLLGIMGSNRYAGAQEPTTNPLEELEVKSVGEAVAINVHYIRFDGALRHVSSNRLGKPIGVQFPEGDDGRENIFYLPADVTGNHFTWCIDSLLHLRPNKLKKP